MIESTLAYARIQRQHHLQALETLLRIPSVSTLPEHEADIRQAAHWLAEYLGEIGMTRVEILPTGGHPVVYGEWLKAGAGKPTLLAYGHYDVQPVDPVDAWRTPPFEPTLCGEDLVCRGVSDDKGQFFAVLAAVESFLKSGSRLPINFKVLLEGEEEINSLHLADLLHRCKDMLAADAVLIVDQSMVDPRTPVIEYGSRGITHMEVEVRGPASDLHSGTFGGAVDNPLNVLVRLLAALQDPVTRRIVIPGFYDRVRPLADDERELWKGNPMTDETIQRLVSVPALAGEQGYTALERMSGRPTFEIHGIRGGFTGPGGKTVIPASALAKVSMRLVPDQDPHDIARLFESHLRSIAPPTVHLQFRMLGANPPVSVDYGAPAVQAAALAYERGLGYKPVYMRGGGTLPIARDLQDTLGAPVVMIGFGLPDDNCHAPNEKLSVSSLYKGIETVIHYFSILAG